MKTQILPKNIELRRISLYLIGIGLFMLLLLSLIMKDVKVMRLEVDFKEMPVKTSQSMQLGGNELIYGTKGILKYHPESVWEILMYGEFLSGMITPTPLDALFPIFTGIYLFWVSRATSKTIFFDKETHKKFRGLVMLWLVLVLLRYVAMNLISNHFYESNSHMYAFPVEDIYGNSKFIWISSLVLGGIDLLFTRGIKIQKEQDFTI